MSFVFFVVGPPPPPEDLVVQLDSCTLLHLKPLLCGYLHSTAHRTITYVISLYTVKLAYKNTIGTVSMTTQNAAHLKPQTPGEMDSLNFIGLLPLCNGMM